MKITEMIKRFLGVADFLNNENDLYITITKGNKITGSIVTEMMLTCSKNKEEICVTEFRRILRQLFKNE